MHPPLGARRAFGQIGERAQKKGIVHFARARTVGCHAAFIGALADLAEVAARERGWI